MVREVLSGVLGLAAFAIMSASSALVSTPCQQENELIHGQEATEFDHALQRFSVSGFSGVVLVLRNGEPILRRSYGFSRREENARNTTGTPFPVCSVTKQFIAAAILRLEMEGKLRTSDPVSKYLGKFPGQRGEPTIQDLLTHTSGLIHPDTSFASHSAIEFVEKLKTFPRESEPRKQYRYSNGGYSLLAAIIERASAKPLEVYLRENLFQPIGMTCTGFLPVPDTAQGYEIDEKWISTAANPSWFYRAGLGVRSQPEFRLAPPIPNDWSIRASGGIITTLGDIEKWERAIRTNSILSADATNEMFRPHIPLSSAKGQAYSWTIEKTSRGKRVAYQYGDYWGYQSAYIRYLDEGLTLFVATNVSVGRSQGWRGLVRDTFERMFSVEVEP